MGAIRKFDDRRRDSKIRFCAPLLNFLCLLEYHFDQEIRPRQSVARSPKRMLPDLIVLFRLIFLAVVFTCFQSILTAHPYAPEYEKSPEKMTLYENDRVRKTAQEIQELHRKRVPIQEAVGPEALNVAVAKRTIQDAKTQNGSLFLSTLLALRRQDLCIAALFILTGIVTFRLFAPEIASYVNRRFKAWKPVPAEARVCAGVRAEEESLSEFVASFRLGPATAEAQCSADGWQNQTSIESTNARSQNSAALRTVRQQLSRFHERLDEVNQTTNLFARQQILADLQREITIIKDATGKYEMISAWQLSSALEGLLKQLSRHGGAVTASTLRTVRGGIKVLGELCNPDFNLGVLGNAPIRFLAVDDDMISRTAISLALKRAFSAPDMAVNAEEALARAGKEGYDVIFLDVLMSGMDGFELCTRIRETGPNRKTPVVFVTGMNDFEARAKHCLEGERELIGKPFLTFELTVKALTLALQRRIGNLARPSVADTDDQEAGKKIQTLSLANAHSTAGRPDLPSSEIGVGADSKEHSAGRYDRQLATMNRPAAAGTDRRKRRNHPRKRDRGSNVRVFGGLPVGSKNVPSAVLPSELSPQQRDNPFAPNAVKQIASIREIIMAISRAEDFSTCSDKLADIRLRVLSLVPNTAVDKQTPGLRLLIAFAGLVKNLLEKPEFRTCGTLRTMTQTVDLLQDLCACDMKSDSRATASRPFQMLVVDDDLLSRRAMSGALQMAFEKPEAVEDGAAALEAAEKRTFDVIFLDVQMPETDGFTVCSKIRQTQHNRNTPVVFVTGLCDVTQEHVTASGGNDLIRKPFLTSEVTLKALTYTLRGRLLKAS